MNINPFFLAIGKTYESTEAFESKKYIGVGSSFVLAVNPTKQELEQIYGHEVANEPVYVDEGKEVGNVRIDFIVKTDPALNDGIEAINKATFFLSDEPAYNKDKTKVQVIDKYGNFTFAPVEDVRMSKKLLSANGKEMKIVSSYRAAYRGEADLVDFLKKYLGVQDAFNYANGSWELKENPEDYEFGLEHIKDYFSGDVRELKEALKLQPNNKIKLLYGVRTTEKGQFQAVCTRSDMTLRNSANANSLLALEKNLANAKLAGAFKDTEYRACPLQEYKLEATDLSSPDNGSVESDPLESSDLPWD